MDRAVGKPRGHMLGVECDCFGCKEDAEFGHDAHTHLFGNCPHKHLPRVQHHARKQMVEWYERRRKSRRSGRGVGAQAFIAAGETDGSVLSFAAWTSDMQARWEEEGIQVINYIRTG